VIHAYALEPELVASWGTRAESRFVRDNFGIGTPRVMLELPSFSKWKRAVYMAATAREISQEDMKRIEVLFRLFAECKCSRADRVYHGLLSWLENAEHECDRKSFAAILATANPRGHAAVLVDDQLVPTEPRWACARGATTSRTPEALAAALSPMLMNCRALHLVDPHFGPEKARYQRVLEALMNVLAENETVPEVVRVHCLENSSLAFFEQSASRMAERLPIGIKVEFARWKQRDGGDKLHDRYVLTDLGGVSVSVGLDAGEEGETNDLFLLSQDQYARRWSQYVESDRAFEKVDDPAAIQGSRHSHIPRGR
jgi:hypothetical protein